jgi:hypothetical protein
MVIFVLVNDLNSASTFTITCHICVKILRGINKKREEKKRGKKENRKKESICNLSSINDTIP